MYRRLCAKSSECKSWSVYRILCVQSSFARVQSSFGQRLVCAREKTTASVCVEHLNRCKTSTTGFANFHFYFAGGVQSTVETAPNEAIHLCWMPSLSFPRQNACLDNVSLPILFILAIILFHSFCDLYSLLP